MSGKNQRLPLSRRNLLKLGAGAIGTGALTVGLGCSNKNEAVSEPTKGAVSEAPKGAASPIAINPNEMTPDQILQKLMEGNQRFVANKRTSPNQDMARLTEVAKGQNPFAAILGCADSRVPSEIVFDQGLGDLFVCRVAGNIATPEEIGSLEFGTLVLGAKVIMVIGHEKCGAVDATIKGAQVPGQIASLLEAIKPAADKSKGQSGDPLENATKANVLYQAEKLKASPVISQLINEGKLKVVGGYYDLDTGTITVVS
ncbi:MAG: carbonic anhydrase [Oscillatoria princeps RMCB-10]|jgi:carbonic anhydrase|nr:carbonic anhydrase [Oscillatoria princeps RMCB-10]